MENKELENFFVIPPSKKKETNFVKKRMSLTNTQLGLSIALPVAFVLLLVGWYLAARYWGGTRWTWLRMGLGNPKIPMTNVHLFGESQHMNSYGLDEQLSSYSLSFF